MVEDNHHSSLTHCSALHGATQGTQDMEEKTKRPIPAHIVAQREAQKVKRAKPLRGRYERGEMYDVFRRIDMHNGDKEPCWEWRGSHGLGTRDEYRPRVVIGKQDYYVYRVVYELYTGYKLQKGDVIRHQCDNSWCCNPYHMLIGTQKDNVQDMLQRERVGMKHFHVKRIMQMFELGCTAEFIASKMREGYNMTLDVSVIRKIRLRRVYKHIPWEWGDNYAAERRARLALVKSQRLASVSTHAIIDNHTSKGDCDGDEEDALNS
jgi:hypothetical protein